MAKQTYPIPKSNPNAQVSITFLLLWLVSGGTIALANSMFPGSVVLGTVSLSQSAALILSSGVLAWIGAVTMPIFTEIELRKQMVLSPQHWLLGYLVINVVALWMMGRVSDALGLGFASWMYVLGLAAIVDIVQGMTMMAYGELRKK